MEPVSIFKGVYARRITRIRPKGFTYTKCLQSRSATASLLIKKQEMKKRYSLLLSLLRKSIPYLRYIMGHISPADRKHMRMIAMEKDIQLILYIISIAQVTSRRGVVNPGHCFNLQGVVTLSEACQAANNVTRKVKKRALGKDVWRMHDQLPLCREGAPLMISKALDCCTLLDAHKKKVPNIPRASP